MTNADALEILRDLPGKGDALRVVTNNVSGSVLYYVRTATGLGMMDAYRAINCAAAFLEVPNGLEALDVYTILTLARLSKICRVEWCAA